MKQLFVNVLLLVSAASGLCQSKTLTLYQTSSNKPDTTLYVIIKKNGNGISFVFPAAEPHPYYTLRSDSTWEEHPIPPDTPVFGPYKFKRVAKKILFQDKNISNKYRNLYKLSATEHLSPDLFSSGTNSYTIINSLLESTAILHIGDTTVECYKFRQLTMGHNSEHKYCRIVYIDKANFLPNKIEFYGDKDCKMLHTTIGMKTYTTL